MCVGIPFPSFKDLKIQQKKEYNNAFFSRGLLNGREWYDIQAFRAVNQAIGRCIRHRNDWGAIILLDARFDVSRCTSSISKWIRSRLVHYADFKQGFQSLKGFIEFQMEIAIEDTIANEN